MSEMLAIALLKGGDVSRLEFLVRAHQLRAVRAAYLVCRDRAMAEDVVQGAFVRVYERIGQFDDSREFAPWFMKIVVNDATKAATRRKHTVEIDDHIRSVEDTEPAHDELVQRAEVRDRVWDALVKLPLDEPGWLPVIVRSGSGEVGSPATDLSIAPNGCATLNLSESLYDNPGRHRLTINEIRLGISQENPQGQKTFGPWIFDFYIPKP